MASAEGLLEALEQLVWLLWDTARKEPLCLFLSLIVPLAVLGVLCIYLVLHLFAPKPRAPFPSEKTYISTNPDGTVSAPRPLSCWYDRWRAEGRLSHEYPTIPAGFPVPDEAVIEPAEVEMSVVIPAYNEEARITVALEEMVEYLDREFGRPNGQSPQQEEQPKPTQRKGKKGKGATHAPHRLVFNPSTAARSPQQETTPGRAGSTPSGYEILIVDDGSRDRTVEVALAFSHQHGLHDILRVIKLVRNRGKGGAVTHGLRHVRGQYAVFADADGASRFSDLGRLTEGCEDVVDGSNRGVAIGSRAHLVGSEAVVKRSAIRNLLMRSFHFILTILTPPATSRIRDTQCGFKLFSRAALPHIVPYMHAEGWIFDIEMLMLAESAPATPVLASDGSVIGTSYGIKVAEVPVGWHEVDGSKMSLVQDSVKMAIGLAVLRASWMLGVYRRRLT
ncbi:glycosyltransferase family 2 protein [Trichocladium antarcticum]|uniref:dolichyl-phosphate beta-glucosyltransferase n=1 Tax=Trichocladium antarcticum TaxID=1450529 RepID=A0AAN6ZDJ6_9PEZI|nr:glycosyltransferase family 2 protein [Trichocladium antarcticum]